MSSQKKYTVNKIYFIVDDASDFIEKNKKYLMDTGLVYDVKTYDYNDKSYINIILNFTIGKLNQEALYTFMNSFIIDNNIKNVRKATYKYFDEKKCPVEFKIDYISAI
tara:strand:- start:543 stop:866 length:324 start_codon:yes stop_codon:yes gene_type:complete